uniref:Ubiquitin-like domain-containing protein n=1 Tax=Clytia hemisphaerica TaxID=252671 RepID=A0A7M5VGM7_9CNID
MTITIVFCQQKSIALSKKDVSTLKDLKEQIKNEIGIPEHLQILVNKDHLVLSDSGFAELLQQGKDDISLKFFVKGSDDLEIHAICKEFGINSEIEEVNIHVFTSRQSILDSVQVSLGSKVSDIKNQLDEEYGINKESFFLYHQDFDETEELPLKPIEDDSFLVDLFFKDGEFYAGASVQVMFKDNEDDDWASMQDTLTIYGIRLKNLSDDTVVLEFDGHDIIDTLALKRKVNEKLGIPIELQVFYLDDFLWEECHLMYKFTSYCDSLIDGFFEINFFIFPTEDTLVQKICTENNIFVFDPLPVISGNGTLSDYSFGLNSTVEDLFSFINKEVGIPAPHFVLTADGQELSRMEKKIANIFEDFTNREYSKYNKVIMRKKVGIYIAVKELSENLMNELYLSKGIKALKTITVYYHNKSTLVEKYSVSDIPTLDELSKKLRAHFGVFPPVLFFKNGYMKDDMFCWKKSLASFFFDEETKCYNENIDIFVGLDMASCLVGDNDIAIVNAFCSKHKVNYLQRVVVHFENQATKELKLRVGFGIGKINDLVDKLDLSLKGSFVHNGTNYYRGKRLLEIYFEKEDSSSDSLVFKYTHPAAK